MLIISWAFILAVFLFVCFLLAALKSAVVGFVEMGRLWKLRGICSFSFSLSMSIGLLTEGWFPGCGDGG